MIYKDRVVLVRQEAKEGFLGADKVEVTTDPIPCMENTLTSQEMMGLFGSYRLDGVKLHLQGHHDGFDTVIYKGQKRHIKGKRYHRNSTVVFL